MTPGDLRHLPALPTGWGEWFPFYTQAEIGRYQPFSRSRKTFDLLIVVFDRCDNDAEFVDEMKQLSAMNSCDVRLYR